jgi:hypothetical protein
MGEECDDRGSWSVEGGSSLRIITVFDWDITTSILGSKLSMLQRMTCTSSIS